MPQTAIIRKIYFPSLYGLAFDKCLNQLARVLADFAKRPGDLAAHYGGEELALILPHFFQSEVAQIAERICRSIEELEIPHAGNEEGSGIMTVSIGVATKYPVVDETGADQKTLIQSADERLYAAKRTGRNKIAC